MNSYYRIAETGDMSSDNTKHVQTALPEDEYERFREFAREHGLSIREAGREALVEWIERRGQADPHDRAFTVLDELDTNLPASAESDARMETDLVEEWHGGDDAGFRLADDPSPQS